MLTPALNFHHPLFFAIILGNFIDHVDDLFNTWPLSSFHCHLHQLSLLHFSNVLSQSHLKPITRHYCFTYKIIIQTYKHIFLYNWSHLLHYQAKFPVSITSIIFFLIPQIPCLFFICLKIIRL